MRFKTQHQFDALKAMGDTKNQRGLEYLRTLSTYELAEPRRRRLANGSIETVRIYFPNAKRGLRRALETHDTRTAVGLPLPPSFILSSELPESDQYLLKGMAYSSEEALRGVKAYRLVRETIDKLEASLE
jgi:hypothetical protein